MIVKFLYVKVKTSFKNITSKKIQSREEKRDGYINEVDPIVYHLYERERHPEKYIYCRDINSCPDSIPSWFLRLLLKLQKYKNT